MFFTAGVHWSKVPLSLFAAQYSDFTCLWMSSSSFNDAFIHTPRYLTWFKNCTRTPFRKTFDGAGCLYFFGQKRTSCEVVLQIWRLCYNMLCKKQSAVIIINNKQSNLLLKNWLRLHSGPDLSLKKSTPVSSEISDVCEISDLLLFFSDFASQNKEITSGNSFFDVCFVNENILARCQIPTTSCSTGIIFTIENLRT